MGSMKEPALGLYETDFHAWTFDQADPLRRGDLKHLDALNLIEQIESLGRSELRELASRLAQRLMHLLKWEHQPTKRTKSLMRTVRDQRRGIEAVLDEMPSLRPKLGKAVATGSSDSWVLPSRETGWSSQTCPKRARTPMNW